MDLLSRIIQLGKAGGKKIAPFVLSPVVRDVAKTVGGIGGMTKDYFEYNSAGSQPEKQKQLIEYNQKRNNVNNVLSGFGFDASKTGNQFDPVQYGKKVGLGGIELATQRLPFGKIPGGINKIANPILKNIARLGIGYGVPAGYQAGAQTAYDTDGDIKSTLKSVPTGGLFGAGVAGAGKIGIGGLNLITKNFKNFSSSLEDIAAQSLTKATPQQYQKAVEEAGVDINKLVKKYIPAGSNFDDIVGDISKRGKGGVVKDLLDKQESIIQGTAKRAGSTVKLFGDDLIKSLKKESRIIQDELGGGNRDKAIKSLVAEAEKKYKNGITVKKAVDILRRANKKFGKNIVDSDPGDAIANAAQKLEGNVMRKALKTMFPDMADALDTQSELLTLRPLLNRARSINSTPGSSIRTGTLDALDLSKPLSIPKRLMEARASNPETASNVMQGKDGFANLTNILGKIPEIDSNSGIQSLLSRLGARAASAINTPDQNKNNAQSYPNNVPLNNEVDNEINQSSNLNTNTQILPQNTESQGGFDPESLMKQGYQQSQDGQYLINPQTQDALSTDGQWKFDYEQNDWVPNPQASQPQGNAQLDDISSQLEQGMINALNAGDYKAFSQLLDMSNKTGSMGGVNKDQISGETDLRKEFVGRAKEFDVIKQSYDKISNASPNPQGDMSLIFAYMKMLDPGSTVREGEYANAESTRSVPEEVRASYNKALKGEKLSEGQRAGFKNEAAVIYNSALNQQQTLMGEYEGLAGQYGLDPSRIVGQSYKELKKAEKMQVPQERNILQQILGL